MTDFDKSVCFALMLCIMIAVGLAVSDLDKIGVASFVQLW